jgi:iron complex outermembrane recepter protein
MRVRPRFGIALLTPLPRWVVSLVGVFVGAAPVEVRAEDTIALEDVEVIGVTPTHGVGLPKEMVPAHVQSVTADDLRQQHNLDLSDHLGRNLSSVNLNAAQSNVLQPDVQYRGFTASPLLGLPQGLSVYVNGVRVNEVLGDTVNWDLLPPSVIQSINLIGGANPVFGLNTLGGALSVQTKSGFSNDGLLSEVYGGAFGRIVANVEAGGNNGTWAYFANVRHLADDGWRDAQPSEAFNAYASGSWRSNASTLDLQYFHANTALTGNGPLPVEQLALDRSSFFTAPDITRNHLRMANLEGTHWFGDSLQLSGNAFYRASRTGSFNGDGTPFDECALSEGEFLADEETGLACDGSESLGTLTAEQAGELTRGEDGEPIAGELDAINNRSTRDQRSFGGALQATALGAPLVHDNQLILGAGFYRGDVDFSSSVEAAALDPRRVTTQTGIFIEGESTALQASTQTWSIYLTDTVELIPGLALTLSGRYNATNVTSENTGTFLDDDEDGIDDLSGDHDFARFNPSAGLTWQVTPGFGVYGNYAESSRAPTPVELVCADPEAPCLLPNAFLADPPLDQVVARSIELGARGPMGRSVSWHVGGFHTTNLSDILFLSTGGVTGNQGYFDNVGDTRRMGLEMGWRGTTNQVRWFGNYSFVSATFADAFLAPSPNHPEASNGEIQVESGDRIPGIPAHILKVGADYSPLSKLSVGMDVTFNSGQYLRGDEANQLGTTDAFAIMNVRGQYDFSQQVSLFLSIENLLDTAYETFGLLGAPNEVFDDFEDPRFLGPGAPIGAWVGLTIKL